MLEIIEIQVCMTNKDTRHLSTFDDIILCFIHLHRLPFKLFFMVVKIRRNLKCLENKNNKI